MHDYTKDDVPFGGDNADDFMIGDATAPDKTADQIEGENSFTTVPPGEHLLIVAGFPDPPQENIYKVMVDGRLHSFVSHSVRVRFHLAGQPTCTITDFFLLPPQDPGQLNAYYNGIPEGKKQAGWSASKFVHFINRLGYPFPPGAKLPEAAKRLGNWKGRTIHATVESGRGTYTDKDGGEKPRSNQVKPFSYRASQGTVNGVGASSPQKPGQQAPRQAAPSNQPMPAAAGAGSTYSAGLDNL